MTFSFTRRTALASAATMAAFGGRAALAAPLSLRMASSLPANDNSSHYVWFGRFQQELDQRAPGQVALQYFPDGQLGKEADVIGQLRLGVVDMMISGSSIWSTVAPEVGVLDLGYLFTDFAEAGRLLDGEPGTQLTALLAQKANVTVLGWAFSLGARNVCTHKPVSGPGDLHGLKIRVLPVANFVATLDLMGAVSTPLPLGEVYTALQTGVIDGLEQDAPTILAGKYFEVANQIAFTRHIYNPVIPVIGSRVLDGMPADLQVAIRESAQAATLYQRSRAMDIEQAALEQLRSRGVTTHDVDRAEFRQLVEPLWGEFGAQYPVAQSVLTAIRQNRT